MHRSLIITILAGSFLVFSASSYAKPVQLPEKILDLRKGATHSQITTHDWTLGTTGARGWCQVSHGYGDGGTTLDSRQILITKVTAKTPADGKLKVGDVILGLEGTKFSSDARVAFAKSLSGAEEKGMLSLLVFSKGEEKKVTLALKKLVPFSETAPFNCVKSAFILKNGSEQLAKNGLGRPGIDSNINALALLATGKSQYKGIIRDHAHRIVKSPLKKEMSFSSWYFSFANIFLAEYYLITRDRSVLAEVERMAQCVVDGQGALGTWGHKFKNEETDNLYGYGAVNATGIPCAISLVLARECGVNVRGLDKAIALSRNFFKSYQNLGAIPYGDHPPATEGSFDDNGKNSATAILFSLLGDDEATTYFAKTSLATHGYERERGHAGNFTGIFWSLPAINIAGKEATGAWLKEFGWYFDLARDEKFRFKFQGAPKEKPGVGYASFNCPGAYLLHYALPLRKLRITGRDVKTTLGLNKASIDEIVHYARIDFKKLSEKQLIAHLQSWSPRIRAKAIKEFAKRPDLLKKYPLSLTSRNPMARVAAAKLSNDQEKIATLLNDNVPHVRAESLKILIAKNKKKAFRHIIAHLASDHEVDFSTMQVFTNSYFPFSAKSTEVSSLFTGIEDRSMVTKATKRLLNHNDTITVAGIGMAIPHLDRKEILPLLPLIYEKSQVAPKGNVMFGNRAKLSCTKILANLKLQEGAKSAADLLVDQSWGRNARLPSASRILIQYQGHAKPYLPLLKESLTSYEKGSQWHQLLGKTIQQIEAAPKPKGTLKTISTLR